MYPAALDSGFITSGSQKMKNECGDILIFVACGGSGATSQARGSPNATTM